mmetsp:Transcript_19127/g.39361  ORF Transcript_19127/g.39361 Transcript_19127/m.39361 type:complete len:622 (-) Transcript_19127:1054-2919(-)|eukprot:CAMPEP_0197263664 /NCGR_PEP_ID=MMETSP1432-20130617/1311_1 /TAXON_ID=44447 /ORGANISM="Pseudo-nitzschia delicatissima, Strain UNC1205" /LENGTH=621 /DNA_ID=CAMNT_0042728199 /DNA_START=149 /DNA_END=2014 /DNA_ORIENTATION=-
MEDVVIMKGCTQTKSCQAFVAEQDIDTAIQYSSMKGLSKGFAASLSSSASLDETASNSTLSSCNFSLSSTFSSVSVSEIREQHRSFDEVPVSARLALEDSKVAMCTVKVEDGGYIRGFRNRRIFPHNLLAFFSLDRDAVVWEEVEDDLFILLDGRLDRLLICKEFYFQANVQREGQLGPRRSCDFLLSLGYFLSSRKKDLAMHDEHVSRFASFLSTGRDLRYLKLAVVRTLFKLCLSTSNDENEIRKIINRDTQSDEERLLGFLTNRTREWDHELGGNFSTQTVALVYEIRAKCLRNLELERDRIRTVADQGDSTAVIIATSAKIVELGIQKSNKVMEGQISNVGKKMKGWIDEECQQQQPQQRIGARDAVVARAISSSTKRASEYAQESSKLVAQSTVDTTLSGLYTIGNKVEESAEMADQLSPESREMIKAAGKIGVASVGAVALVAEAVIETSRSLSSKTAVVTADIVGHKYGSVAGELARDAADTYTNMLKTMSNVTLVSNGSKLVKTAAKNVGKNQIDDDVEKAKQIMLRFERQGAIVAKQALGIQWTEGSFTRELLFADVPEERKQEPLAILPRDTFSDDCANSSWETNRDDAFISAEIDGTNTDVKIRNRIGSF